MHEPQAIQPLPPIDVELPSPAKMPPLGFTYSNGKQAMSVIYPQALKGLVQSSTQDTQRPRSPRVDAAIAAMVILTGAVSLALVLTAVAGVMESIHSPREVIIHGR